MVELIFFFKKKGGNKPNVLTTQLVSCVKGAIILFSVAWRWALHKKTGTNFLITLLIAVNKFERFEDGVNLVRLAILSCLCSYVRVGLLCLLCLVAWCHNFVFNVVRGGVQVA